MTSKPTGEGKTTAATSVKSAERILSIFEYFEEKMTPRTLSEIAQDLAYPASSTLALLRSVQAMGYLTYNSDSKAYFPSARFAILGQGFHDHLFEGGVTVQMMEHLATVTRETILLGIQNGLHSQHIRIIPAPQPLSYQPPVGTLRPLLRSAVGRALLAEQTRAMVLKTIERINSAGHDEGRIFKAAEILEDLRTVRESGFAFSANVFTPGVAIISMALPPRTGWQPMTVSVAGPASRVNEDSVPKLLTHMKDVVAQFLGPERAAGDVSAVSPRNVLTKSRRSRI